MNRHRILVTGATGFIGRHLVRYMLENTTCDLTVLVNSRTRAPDSWHRDGRIKVRETGPLETAAGINDLVMEASSIVHLAGLAHARGHSATQAAFISANVKATERLVEASRSGGVRAFINMSSLAAITKNASRTTITDQTHEADQSFYGQSKLQAERLVQKLADRDIFAISLRPPLVVGPDARGNWGELQRLASMAIPLPFASIQNRRSMIDIQSLIAAITALATKEWPASKSGSYCIADEEALSLAEVVTALRDGMRLPARLFSLPPDAMSLPLRLAGKQHMTTSLFGDLVVDASRFCDHFDHKQSRDLRSAIAASGNEYALSRGI